MNMKDIAKLAGVSIASVSRAFQDPPSPYISQKQRQRILDICEELHYYPAVHSKRMNKQCANTVALLSRATSDNHDHDGVSDYFHFDFNFAAVTMGIQSMLYKQDKSLQMVLVTDDFIEERKHIQMVRSKMVDGMLIWGGLNTDTYIHELLAEGIPLVLLTTYPDNCECSKVTADEYGGMSRITEDIIKAGHSKIAVLPPYDLGSAGKERSRGIFETLKKHRIKPCWVAPESGFGFKYGKKMAGKMLEEISGVTCLVAPNDMAAWGCVEALNQAGYRVPDDISVTGADGLPFPSQPRLDSFYLPSYEIGATGAQVLHDLVNGIASNHHQILPVSRIEGNSIKYLPA